MTGIPFAHAGHWYHAILYVLPAILIALGMWLAGRRSADPEERAPEDREDALNELTERFLAGDIEREEYERERLRRL